MNIKYTRGSRRYKKIRVPDALVEPLQNIFGEKKVEEKISYPFILEESPRKALENIFFFIFSDFFVFFYMVRILKISIKYR